MRAAAAASTQSMQQALRGIAPPEHVDEATGWIAPEFWLVSTEREQDLMYKLTQSVALRRREEGRQRQQEMDEDAEQDNSGGDAAGAMQDSADGDAAGDHGDAAGDPPTGAGRVPPNFDNLLDEIQKQRLHRMLSVMEMRVADIQRGLTWIRNQLD